jgi:acyl-CoA synthetase (AMP-forming)/AMP-acid ligase II
MGVTRPFLKRYFRSEVRGLDNMPPGGALLVSNHSGGMLPMDVLEEAGRLFVVGRGDEMIVSGGENLYPIEVEKTLVSHSDVAEASVIGVDDERFGQRLVAFVVLTDYGSASPDVLKQHVRENLANYKVPRDITILDELPRSSTGKIVRRELQDRAGRA